jgi:hypothetical protein
VPLDLAAHPHPPSQESVIPLGQLEPHPAEIKIAEEALEPRLVWRNGKKQAAPPRNRKPLTARQHCRMTRLQIAELLDRPFVEQTLQKRMVRDYRALANRNTTIANLASQYKISSTAMEEMIEGREGWESDIIRKTCELCPKFRPGGRSKPLNSRDDEQAESESEKFQDSDIAKTGGGSIGGRVISRGGKTAAGKNFQNKKLDTFERSAESVVPRVRQTMIAQEGASVRKMITQRTAKTIFLGPSDKSACHIANKPRHSRDRSTNNWWVSLLTLGEGWHNNHHANPVSARHGLKWYEIDFNWYVILLLKRVGLASHVNQAKLSARTLASEPLAPPLDADCDFPPVASTKVGHPRGRFSSSELVSS